MKKCPSCGARQKDSRSTCIDCGALLGSAMSAEEEKREQEILHETLENMAGQDTEAHEETTASSVTRRRIGRFVLVVVCVILSVLLHHLIAEKETYLHQQRNEQSQKIGDGPVEIYLSASDNPYTPCLKRLDTAKPAAIFAASFGIAAMLDLLFPKVGFFLASVRYRMRYKGEPEWTEYYEDFLKYNGIFCLVIAAGFTAAAGLMYLFS